MFYKQSGLLPALFVASLLTQSCATLFSGNKENRVYVTSNVRGISVYDKSNKKLGTTPFWYHPSSDKMVLNFEDSLYTSESVTIQRTEKAGFAFLDAMLLCIPCIVDYSSGAIYRYDKDTVNVKLKRVYNKDVEKIPLNVEEVDWAVKEMSYIGTNGKDEVYFKKSFFDSYIYKETVCRGMIESRYEPFNCELRSGSDFEYVRKYGSLLLTPVIKDFKIDITSKGRGETKTVEFTLTWKFTKNKEGFVVKEVTEKVRKSGKDIETKRLIAAAVLNSLNELLGNEELYAYLMKESKNNDMRQFKNEITIYNPAHPPKFEKSKDKFQHLTQAVITVDMDDSHGSGFLVSEDGYIITNKHVVTDKKVVNVNFGKAMRPKRSYRPY